MHQFIPNIDNGNVSCCDLLYVMGGCKMTSKTWAAAQSGPILGKTACNMGLIPQRRIMATNCVPIVAVVPQQLSRAKILYSMQPPEPGMCDSMPV